MIIGVNALYLIPGGVGGTEVYLRSLLKALARIDPLNQYLVFTNRETGPDVVPPAANFRHLPQPVSAVNRPARILYEQCALPFRGRLDVLFNPGFTAPFFHPAPQVTVFHDLQHKRHPEYFRWFDLPAWRFLLWGAAHKSRKLIAVSEATRADLQGEYGKEAVAIPHGVDERFFEIGAARKAQNCSKPMILYVSTVHPHKNHVRLIRVFARLLNARPELRLVLAGLRGFHENRVEDEIGSLKIQDKVRITGWIPDSELHTLYREASVFVYPSTFEGFGMPVLEALAAGIPMACSDIEPLRSLAGHAAWLFNPLSEDGLFTAIDKLLRGDLPSGNGPDQARQYSWETTAQRTLDVLKSAVS